MYRQVTRPPAPRHGILALLLALTLGTTVPALAQGPQAITIDSNLTVKVRPYSPIHKVIPFASVVLLTGGNGVLDLNAAGDIRDSQGNFLIRSARRFLNARLNVAMLDAEPAFPAQSGLTNQRLTQAHADHLAQVIAVVRTRWPGKPVWLVGTSNGTLSVFNAAARLTGGAQPNGIVLTSTVTKPDPAGEMGHVLGTNPSLASITVPTLVMWHEKDSCFVTPPSDATNIFGGLTSLPLAKKAWAMIKGGQPNVAVTACGAFHYHGYNGVEQEAVTAIAKFIRSQPPPKMPPPFKKPLDAPIDKSIK
jgi:pimeloyl-ACP methyl ester carboxylesterase